METTTRQLEISSVDGKLLFTVLVTEKAPTNANGNQAAEPAKSGAKGEQSKPRGQNGDVPMTDAQKRYLFRILADQGIEGTKASERLKQLFQVTALKEITKLEASQMIERLLEEVKGGGDGRVPV